MLLYLLHAAVEPGSGTIDIPPVTDPTGRIIAVVVALSAMFGPWLTAKVKKGASNGPTPLGTGAPTQQLGVGEEWLKKYIKGLEDNVKSVEAENAELKAESAEQRRQILALIEDRATFRAQNEALRQDIAALRDEVMELRGQLRGRGSGR